MFVYAGEMRTSKGEPVVWDLDAYGASQMLTIRHWLSGRREELDTYLLTQIPSDFGGIGWQLDKVTPGDEPAEVYHCLAARGQVTCDCRGYEAHRRCKHSTALVCLTTEGRVAVPACWPKDEFDNA